MSIALQNHVITIIIIFQHDNEFLKHMYSLSTVTITCYMSITTHFRLVGVQLSSVVMQVSARIDHKCTCTCSSSTPVVHRASSRLCRQLRVHTDSLLALE